MSHPDAPGHYFSTDPGARSAPTRVRVDLPDLSFELGTDRGVFSPDRLDTGTKLLLMEAPAPDAGSVAVDVGCGYGPIALTLARRRPEAVVWAVDVNARARELCRANAVALAAGGVRVAAPEEVPAGLVVDGIWSNPPIRIGKAALHGLLNEWLVRLRPGGSAWLVVHKHLGADSLADWLTATGRPTERVRSRAGYRLLRVTAPLD